MGRFRGTMVHRIFPKAWIFPDLVAAERSTCRCSNTRRTGLVGEKGWLPPEDLARLPGAWRV